MTLDNLHHFDASDTMETDREFWARFWSALQRLVALGVVMVAHKALNWGLAFIIPASMIGVLPYLEALSVVAFGIIYVYLLWETVGAFVPSFRTGRADKKNVAPPSVVSEPGDE
jgi:hypothetical protein